MASTANPFSPQSAAERPVPSEEDDAELRAGRSDVDLQEQFRQFQAFMATQRQTGTRGRGPAGGDDEDREDKAGSTGPPPEWSGEPPFEDYLIRARLWIATTKARPTARGPLLLKSLKGAPFECFKHLAKDPTWLSSVTNAEDLLQQMDTPEYYGDDQEEHLLASLARITFHLKRGKNEGWREYFAKWDNALRKVRDHHVDLPAPYLGFLLIHGLRLSDQDIKSMLSFTRGGITPPEIQAWLRKKEAKLTIDQLGNDSKEKKGNAAIYHTEIHDEDMEHFEETVEDEEQEIMALEKTLGELQSDPGGLGEDEVLSEGEAAEVLSMLLAKKKKTFVQTQKAKKNFELSRGYGKGGGKSGGTGSSSRASAGTYRMKGDFTVEEVKRRTRCSRCLQLGHWWKECPNPTGPPAGPRMEAPRTATRRRR